MNNPEIVVNSIIDSEGVKTDNNISIYPCTIRRYAVLEKLNSPFIDQSLKFDVNSIIPSAYVFSCETSKLKQYTTKDIEALINDSFDWAESISLSDIPQIIQIITLKLAEINKSAPTSNASLDVLEDGTKKK